MLISGSFIFLFRAYWFFLPYTVNGGEVRTANPVCVRGDPMVHLKIGSSGSSCVLRPGWVEALEVTGAIVTILCCARGPEQHHPASWVGKWRPGS